MTNYYLFYLLMQRMIMTESILNSLPGSLYWKDKEGHYLGRNTASQESMKTYGFMEGDVNGLTDFDLFPEEQAQQFKEHDELTLKTKKEQVLEEVIHAQDGSLHVHYSIKRPLLYNNEVIGVVGNSINITHLKEIEEELIHLKAQAESSEKAKNIFFQHIEHDLTTPNSIIELATEALLKNEKDKHRVDLLNNIRFYSQQLTGHINQLIDFSRIGNVHQLQLEPMNLGDLVSTVFNASRFKNSNASVSLTLAIDPVLPKTIMGNTYALTRILTNMMDNSLKFTRSGDISLRVRTSSAKESKKYFYIEINDTGEGIAPEDISHVFDLFFRRPLNRCDDTLSKGLGLSIVKQLIELLKGTVSVKSQRGVGTEFLIQLPLSIPLEANELTSVHHQLSHALTEHDISMLLIEDHPLCAEMAANLLKAEGFHVHIAHSGQEALQQLNDSAFDVILTDLNLPDMNGFDLAKIIKTQLNNNLSSSRIVALSANSQASFAGQKNINYIDVFLTKPLCVDTLKAHLAIKTTAN